MSDIRLLDEPPPVEALIKMRAALGWGEISKETAERALSRADFAVTCWVGDDVAGFGRAFGDGLYYLVEDIIVAPDYQGQGIGARIVRALVEKIEADAPKGGMIGLMAAAGKEGFYEKLGFTQRPNAAQGAGMSMIIGS